MRALVYGSLLALAVLGLLAGEVVAQVDLCTSSGVAASPGTRACDGGGSPVTVSATVRTYARLALEEVFGRPAAGLRVAMGDVDAGCVSASGPGVACLADAGAATWFGDVRFRVTLTGLGTSRAKLAGLRPGGGTIPGGRLLDGAAGALPTAPYPVAPASAAELRGAIGNGDTVVARSLGLRVLGSDPPGAWSGDAVFSLVLE